MKRKKEIEQRVEKIEYGREYDLSKGKIESTIFKDGEPIVVIQS